VRAQSFFRLFLWGRHRYCAGCLANAFQRPASRLLLSHWVAPKDGASGAKRGFVTESKTPGNSSLLVVFYEAKMSVKNLWSFIKKLRFRGVFLLKKNMAQPLLMPVPVANSSTHYKEKVAVLIHTTE
jgi:hypothetical protein